MNKLVEKLVELRLAQKEAEDKFNSALEEVRAASNDEELDEANKKAEASKEELEEAKKNVKRAEEELEEQEEQNEEILKEEEGRKSMNNEIYTRKVSIETEEEKRAKIQKREQRANALIEGRSVTVAAAEVLVPEHQATELQTYPFKPYTSLVDLVKIVPLQGGESYEKAFVKDYGVAGTTLEGADYAETEPTFGYANISKVKITAYAEVTEEVLKLPRLNYEAEVLKNINVSLKKKIAQQITLGAGSTNTFKGIFADNVEALTDADVLAVSEITDTTLDEILFSFGGDEEVHAPAVLILNKLDLKAFATLRNVDGNKTYNVDYKAQTIDGIPYVINSNCPALSATGTAADTYCMAYGTLDGYEVPIFSDVEIMKSTDYKFRQGIVCYKASVFAGGNVGSYRSFVRIKKSA